MFLALTLIIAGIVIAYAYIKKKIDASAGLASIAVGLFALFTVGPYWLYLILGFFVFGNLVTRFKYNVKKDKGVAERERTFRNVFGNGGAALVFALFFAVTKNPIFLLGYLGSMASAAADTFATEIGMVYDIEPRMITTFKKTRIGANGAISTAGTAAAVLGAVSISLIPLLFPSSAVLGLDKNLVFSIGVLGGLFGSFVDSLVGATIEGKLKIVDNHMTNFIGTLAGGAFAVLLFRFLLI